MTFARRPIAPARRLLLVTVVLALGAAACGVPEDDGPRTLPSRDLPPQLLATDPRGTTSTTRGPGATNPELVALFFINGQGRLTPTFAELARSASLTTVLDALASGPSDELVEEGFRTALGAPDVVESVSLSRGVANVDLLPGARLLSADEQILALGQLVLTFTSRPGVGQVRFTLEGEAIEVPTGDGALTSRAVTADDYRTLLASP